VQESSEPVEADSPVATNETASTYQVDELCVLQVHVVHAVDD